ncbi:hypothetical protein FDF50_08340 [Clostridium botulinum]|uniref:Phage tail protein n=1 Tax=Clostridium botulinum TaxID=1491 RepID=A0A6G4HPE0_CLOBO|nr:hypothetical protein [Clostridium botulinum]MBO0571845.1 hypothetical protein [Clostridium botulinum]NFJ61656.1 hypothetical protein [Clostridium botulinum]NFQ62493.1 hypothetical protein [Clostridium botulinum]NFR17715.1 hypothetical protein [Clostridium botulinum]NFU16764.1 hypothetical protein [Clostridium botulinum]
MAIFKNMCITEKGISLYAKAQAGQQIKFTKFQIGSGQIENRNPMTLTTLLEPKLDVPIVSIIANSELKSAAILGKITNKNVNEAMYICELGLFANDPDEGEILYGYVSAGQYGDYYAPESHGSFNWEYQVNASVGNAANVTAEICELDYDYTLLNTNKIFLRLTGGNQKEINKSIDDNFESVAKQLADITKEIKDNDKNIKFLNIIKRNISIKTTGWVKDSTLELYKYKIQDADITENTIVDVNIRISDLEKASDFKSSNQSFNGYVEIYSDEAPKESIICDLKLIRQVL